MHFGDPAHYIGTSGIGSAHKLGYLWQDARWHWILLHRSTPEV
jgi:hypothetical protein